MNKQQMIAFWRETIKAHKKIDRLQLVYADGVYNYDADDRPDLLRVAQMAFEKGEDAEVRVDTNRWVTFIITMDERIFDL